MTDGALGNMAKDQAARNLLVIAARR
jgi:hypothetical protein